MTKAQFFQYTVSRMVLGIVLFLASSIAQGASFDKDFLIDRTKPFVYLEADHVGPRHRLRSDEPSVGLWMRLRNNCKVPIVVATFSNLPSRSGETNLMDEVVPNPPLRLGDTAGSGMLYEKDQEGFRDIFLNPNRVEAEVRGAEESAKEAGQSKGTARPHGYNGGLQPGVEKLKVIPPGGEILFSVPTSHISETWHLEVPFRFAISNEEETRQPYSSVAYFWNDLPEADRTAIRKDQASTFGKPSTMSTQKVEHLHPYR